MDNNKGLFYNPRIQSPNDNSTHHRGNPIDYHAQEIKQQLAQNPRRCPALIGADAPQA